MSDGQRMASVELGEGSVGWGDVVRVACHGAPLTLAAPCLSRLHRARAAVEAIADSDQAYYGINTGLGALCDVVLERDALSRLSRHTLMSHACGVGEPLRREQVRAIMCCAVVNYSHGHSGISPGVVEALVGCLNAGITPVVPARGSVGYLTHMAHIGLALIGVGEVEVEGKRLAATLALDACGLVPVTLGPKDGLSLVNGTPAMTGLACLALDGASRLADWADIIGAMSFDALRGQRDALGADVAALKRHPGVATSARHLRRLLEGSAWLDHCHGDHLQDALSLRSMPQVHGACRDQLDHAARQVDAELCAATDNPLVIETEQGVRVVSQANPHGASVALACDALAMAVCEWGSISERRSYRLVTPQVSQLPAFLTHEGGVKSGLMIAQYAAASLAADLKRLAQPAVTDNYLTSGLQEDHLSLGDSAALKLDRAVDTALRVLGIEYLLAAQAMDLIGARDFGVGTTLARRDLRERIAYYDEGHPLSEDMEAAYRLISHPTRLETFAEFFQGTPGR